MTCDSAETLRRAAALMRERAEAATHPVVTAWVTYGQSLLIDEARGSIADSDATHIASWHPAVALAVADWLDLAAEGMEELGIPTLPGDRALAVANAYLQETR